MSELPADLPPQQPSATEDFSHESAVTRVFEGFVHDIFGAGSSAWRSANKLFDGISDQLTSTSTSTNIVFCTGRPVQFGEGRLDVESGGDSGSGGGGDGAQTRAGVAVNDRGPIQSIDMPAGWTQRDVQTGGIGNRSLETFAPPNEKDVGISVFYGGLPASAKSAQAFLRVLNDKPATDGPQRLTTSEIKELSEVMGRLQAGDNQYTNSGKYRAPVFNLTDAYTMNVNGRTVLAVQGNFVDKDGKPSRGFNGVFVDSDGTGQRVQQIFLQGNPAKLSQYQQQFQDTVASIEWKPTN